MLHSVDIHFRSCLCMVVTFHMYPQHSLQAWCLSCPWDGQVSGVVTINMVGADTSTSFCIHNLSPFCVSGVYDSGPGSMMSVLYL